ncbi:MAG: hypothetical protein HFACDABA_01202 [Anaerolineales bacterium]|nr:hypothetical protein [Anaerolineales bacterium]
MPALESLLADLISGDDSRAEAACAALSQIGETLIPHLRDLLSSPDADSRWWATRALASLPHLDPALLIPSLADSSTEVRQCAALGLRDHPIEAAIRPLTQALNDADSLTAQLAAQALAAIGHPAVESLLDVLRSGPPSAKIHAARALAEITDVRAIRPMIESMSEDSAALQYWAERGLEKLGVNMIYVKP